MWGGDWRKESQSEKGSNTGRKEGVRNKKSVKSKETTPKSSRSGQKFPHRGDAKKDQDGGGN